MKDFTIKEKLDLLIAKDLWSNSSAHGKIKSLFLADGPLGIRKEKVKNDVIVRTIKSIGYPSMNVVANTWNSELVFKFGECLGEDAIEKKIDILLGPGVNIKRNPLCGRNFEYFSEDPVLAGELAKQYILGVQSKGIGTSLKHFACNNLEVNRHDQDSLVDERTLREIYYKPFEIAVEAKPTTIMCSYNKINGVPACENKSGFDILRNEYGFDGVIVSDWEAVKSRNKSLNAGLDLEFPYREKTYKKFLLDYKKGLVDLKKVDESSSRIIDLTKKIEKMSEKRVIKRTRLERQNISRKIQEEGIVLLKNDNILPLKREFSLAVSGLFASPYYKNYRRKDVLGGGGSAYVERYHPGFNLPRGLAKELEGKVYYEVAISDDNSENYELPQRAVEQAKKADVCLICVGTGSKVEFESNDRYNMYLPRRFPNLFIKTIAKYNPNVIVCIMAGAPIDVSSFVDDVKAIIYTGFLGDEGDKALIDILMGRVSPSGKLSETWGKDYSCYPCAHTYMDALVTEYSEGLDVGYRYFYKHVEQIRYPFGFGLSYTEFSYENLSLVNQDESILVSFDVKNIGEMDGKETAQVYVRKINSKVTRPLKELKGFLKKEIKKGSYEHYEISLSKHSLEYFDVEEKKFVLEEGVYEILVCSNSCKVELKGEISL